MTNDSRDGAPPAGRAGHGRETADLGLLDDIGALLHKGHFARAVDVLDRLAMVLRNDAFGINCSDAQTSTLVSRVKELQARSLRRTLRGERELCGELIGDFQALAADIEGLIGKGPDGA